MAQTASTMLALGTIAPDFALTDVVSGKTVHRDDFRGKKALLVMFICAHCPFVKHIEKDLAKLGKDYAGAASRHRRHQLKRRDHSSRRQPRRPQAAGRDVRLRLSRISTMRRSPRRTPTMPPARRTSISSTPISVSCTAASSTQAAPATASRLPGEDLRAAIDTVLAGKPVPADQHPSIGCNIKWKA